MVFPDKINRGKTLASISVIFTALLLVVAFIFFGHNVSLQNLKCFFIKNKNPKTELGITQDTINDPFQEFRGFSDTSNSIFIFLQEDISRAELENILNKIVSLGSSPIGTNFIRDESIPKTPSMLRPTIQVSLPLCVSKEEFMRIIKTLRGVDGADTCLEGWCGPNKLY